MAHTCEELSRRLIANRSLQELIANDWKRSLGSADQPEADSLYHQMVFSHQSLRLASDLSDQDSRSTLAQMAISLNDQMRADFKQASPAVQADVVWHLRHYRHATLQLSWLSSVPRTSDDIWRSALENALAGDGRVGQSRDTLTRDLPRDLSDPAEAKMAITRIATAIDEVGYAAFVGDVTSAEMKGGDDSPLGSGAVQVIPKTQGGDRAAILLAVCQGAARKARGFAAVMPQLLDHLAARGSRGVLAIVCSDTWDREKFHAEHLAAIREQYERGARFLFLLVGEPERLLTRIPVEIGPGAMAKGERKSKRPRRLVDIDS